MKIRIIIVFILTSIFYIDAQNIQLCSNGRYGVGEKKAGGKVHWIIVPQYTEIEKFEDKFLVRDDFGLWGVLSQSGEEIIPCEYWQASEAKNAFGPNFTFERDYTNFIKSYVENKINAWQKKDEFEKTSDYLKRVTDDNRKAMVEQLTREVCDECLRKVGNKKLEMILKEYDADNETFLIDTSIGQLIIPVEIGRAPDFKANWSDIVAENTYDIVNGKIILRSAIFTLDNKVLASYNGQNTAPYSQANVEYNFDPIDVPIPNAHTSQQPVITTNTIQVGKSDVDINVPKNNVNKEKTFALILANENYREEIPVNYALNDGNSIENYFNRTLGIPERNIHFIKDATKNDFIREMDWLKQVANAYKNDVNLIVYYAGHGAPNESDGSAYLIPIDGSASNPKTLYSLNEFYSELGSLSVNNTIVFMDACFSGASRGKEMLTAARGVAIKSKPAMPKENMIVFSAAQGDETAWPYAEKNHGLFTYFFLKKLQNSNGDVTLGDLAAYITSEVGKHSVVVNSKPQTPSVSVSPKLSDVWQAIKLK